MTSSPATRDGPRTETLRVQTLFAPGSFLGSSLMRVVKQTVLPQLHQQYRELTVAHVRRAVAAERAKQEQCIRELEGRIVALEARDRERETAIAAATAKLDAEYETRVAAEVSARLEAELAEWETQARQDAPQHAERFANAMLTAAEEFFRDHPLDDLGGNPHEEPGAGA